MSRVNEDRMPMKKDTEDIDGDGQTDDQVPAFLQKGDVKKKKTGRPQPPQLAKAQGKNVDESHCPDGKRDGDVEEGKKKSKKCPVCKKVKCEGSCNEGQINEENEDDGSPATTTRKRRRAPGEEEAKPPADQQKPKDRGVTMENWTRKNKNELLFERLVKKWAK